MDRSRTHVLRVDLSAGETRRERVPDGWRRDFLGGKGLGARYLYEELAPGVDPTGPENLLAFAVGPLSGYFPGETRYAAVTKSPLTGGFLDSYSGGDFAARLAGSLADCLGLLVTGVADEPVRIAVEDGRARIEPAATWGRDVGETADAFPDDAVACIGPAGEREVAYATIASDGGAHHAGRGGAGAVMGSKRLKAVVARGGPPDVPPALVALRDRDADAYQRHETGAWQAAGGTLETVDFADEVGVLSAEGWTETGFEGTDDIGIEAARERAVDREGDAGVPGDYRFDGEDGPVVPRGAAPITLGAGLGVDDFDAVVALGGLCDRLGIDVIGAGNAVAWAVRADDAGVLDCPVSFGDEEGARRLLEAIATRSGAPGVEPGLPDALADGIDAAAERFGGADLVPTVKSMALPGFDPRAAVGVALAYATSDRGACHRRARPHEREPFAGDDPTLADRVRSVVAEQTVRSVLWSLVVDDFVGETVWDDLGREWLAAAGVDADADALFETGERIWTLVRLFNAREGFDRDDDALPTPLRSPAGDDAPGIDAERFERMLDAYYATRGWGENGRPTRATVERLGLAGTVDDETPLDDPIDRPFTDEG